VERVLAIFISGLQIDRGGITKRVILTKSVIFPLTKFVQTNAPAGHFGIVAIKVKRGVHFVRL
jgi:hypothetical protein